MSQSRRDFIKFVVAGSVAAGCPVDAALFPRGTTTLPSPFPIRPARSSLTASISRSATKSAMAATSDHLLLPRKQTSSSPAAASLAFPPLIFFAARIGCSLKKNPTSAATPTRKNLMGSPSPPAPLSRIAAIMAISSLPRLA